MSKPPTKQELIDVLSDELKALLIWQTSALPNDVQVGVEISMDKIATILEKTGRLA